MNKLYPCKKCGIKVPIRSKGLCPKCRYEERKDAGELPIQKNKIQPITQKTKNRKIEERGCLKAFFEYHIAKLEQKPVSMESGKIILFPGTVNICHLLPKRKTGGFPSVQCDLSNAIYLTWQEHSAFDIALDQNNYTFLENNFPKVWKLGINILILLLEKVTERNKMYWNIKEYIESDNCKAFFKSKIMIDKNFQRTYTEEKELQNLCKRIIKPENITGLDIEKDIEKSYMRIAILNYEEGNKDREYIFEININ